MPVQTYDAEATGVDPFRRLSASQVNLWKAWPRQWYYAYQERLKGPMPPVIIRGNAAEECICRVLRDSPSLISRDSNESLISPLNEDGAPDWEDTGNWMATRLNPLGVDDRPKNREELMHWALGRVEIHFDQCWDAAVEDWQSTQNRAGSLEDIESQECLDMILSLIHI